MRDGLEAMPGFEDPEPDEPSLLPDHVAVPSAPAVPTPAPQPRVDPFAAPAPAMSVPVEIDPQPSHEGSGTSDLIDITASPRIMGDLTHKVRQARVPEKALKVEETAHRAWRQLLTDLPGTELVHVKLLRRGPDGAYTRLGARYNVDVEEVRQIERLVPYGTGSDRPANYILKVAPASARVDDDSQYRKFAFSRVGPEPPPGWALDSGHVWLDEEVDMATARELFNLLMQQQPQQAQQQQPGFVPAGQAGIGMPYPGYPFVPPPWMTHLMAPSRPAVTEESDRRAEDRHREEMRRLEERAAAAERAAAEAARAIQETKQTAAMQDIATKLQSSMEAMETRHNATIQALQSKMAEGSRGNTSEIAALFTGLMPVLDRYLSSQTTASAESARARVEELRIQRELQATEADNRNRWFSNVLEQQQRNSALMNEMVLKTNDPERFVRTNQATMELTHGLMSLMANSMKSGLLGGGAAQSGPTTGQMVVELLGNTLDRLGGMGKAYFEAKAMEAEEAAQKRPQAADAPLPQPRAAEPSPRHPEAEPAKNVAPEERQSRLVRAAGEEIRAALNAGRSDEDAVRVVDMLDAWIGQIAAYRADRFMPGLADVLVGLRTEPAQVLEQVFRSENKDFVARVAALLLQRIRTEEDSASSETEPVATTVPAPIPQQVQEQGPEQEPELRGLRGRRRRRAEAEHQAQTSESIREAETVPVPDQGELPLPDPAPRTSPGGAS